MGSEKVNIHFLVGIGRSGTTLLSSILNCSPYIAAAPEGMFLLYYLNDYIKKEELSHKEIELFLDTYSDLVNGRFVDMKLWMIDKELLKKRLFSYPSLHYKDLVKEVYMASAFNSDKQQVKVILDKNPPYTMHIGSLIKSFPGSKYIVMVRNYRDNVASRNRFNLDNSKDDSYNAVVWNDFNKYVLRMKALHPDRILILKYEDFVSSPESTIRTACEFLDVDFTEDMMNYQEKNQVMFDKIRALVPEGKRAFLDAMHGRIKGKVDSSRINSFKEGLHEKHLKVIEYICHETGANLGYEPLTDYNISLLVKGKVVLYKLNHKITMYVHNLFYNVPLSLRIPWLRFKRSSKLYYRITKRHPG